MSTGIVPYVIRLLGLIILAIVSFCTSWAQIPKVSGPDSVAPQIVINVRKHAMGADMVEITAGNSKYPPELLRSQCLRLGEYLNSEPRGLAVYTSGTDPKFKFLKAGFAVDGILNRETGTIDLNSVAQAFCGVPAPFTTKSLLITLEGEKPVDRQTLRDFSSNSVQIVAHISEFPAGIEYRILLLTQDSEKLDIPLKFVETPSDKSASTPKSDQLTKWLVPLLIGVAGISGIALVYFAFSGRSRSKKERRDQRT